MATFDELMEAQARAAELQSQQIIPRGARMADPRVPLALKASQVMPQRLEIPSNTYESTGLGKGPAFAAAEEKLKNNPRALQDLGYRVPDAPIPQIDFTNDQLGIMRRDASKMGVNAFDTAYLGPDGVTRTRNIKLPSQQTSAGSGAGRGVRRAAAPAALPKEDDSVLIQRGLTTTRIGGKGGWLEESAPINDTFEAQLQRAQNIDSETYRSNLDYAINQANQQESEDVSKAIVGTASNDTAGLGISSAEAQRINGEFGVRQAQTQANATLGAAGMNSTLERQRATMLQQLSNPATTPEQATRLKDALSAFNITSSGTSGSSANNTSFLNALGANTDTSLMSPDEKKALASDVAYGLSLVDKGLLSQSGALAEVNKRRAARYAPQEE